MENRKSRLDRWLRPLGGTLIVLAGFLAISLSLLMREEQDSSAEAGVGIFNRLLVSSSIIENWFYDLRNSRFFDHDQISPHLVILEITDVSLQRVGRWPWTRTKHAAIIDNLRTYGAKDVMFDALFPEPENDAADQALADAINRFAKLPDHAVIFGYGTTGSAGSALKPMPDSLFFSQIYGARGPKPMNGDLYVDKNQFAAPRIAASQATFGFISARADVDGIFRHMQLVNEADNIFLPSLGLAGFEHYWAKGKEQKLEMGVAENNWDLELRLFSVRGVERRVRLNSHGEMRVRFFGNGRNFERVSADEVILDPDPEHNEKFKKLFQNKAVLVGSSAFGAHDLRHTPMDTQTPGMYMHANLFHSLDQNFVFQSENWSALISYLLFLLGVLSVFQIPRIKNPIGEAAGLFALLAGLFFLDRYYFSPQGYFVRLFFVLACTLWLHAWFTLLNVLKESREKRKIRDAFSRYVAPEIVKEMLANPEKLKVGGEKREITMLFSDVRNFTSISERLSANDLASMLNIYMDRMTGILFDSGGTLDKYIGDAMVGFWGAPLDIPDHAYKAVRGAKLMLEALPEINKEFELRSFPRINVGIGLNTGEASVGNMGSSKIFQYTALGDNMNLASRLESLTKFYGVNLIISEFTLVKLGDRKAEFRIRPLDCVQVKGKSRAVKIYEVIPNWSPWATEDTLLEKYLEAYERKYLQRRFAEAKAQFSEILEALPGDQATLKLKQNAEEFLRKPPPDDWDGITVFHSKMGDGIDASL